jgi:hypothetical protein
LECDFATTVNGLKVMSRLNPVEYDGPVGGQFDVQCLDSDGTLATFTIMTHFDDQGPDPFFELKATRKAALSNFSFSV